MESTPTPSTSPPPCQLRPSLNDYYNSDAQPIRDSEHESGASAPQQATCRYVHLDATAGTIRATANDGAAYDETDGDFAFTRKPKRSKALLEPIAETEAAPAHALRTHAQDTTARNEPAKEAPKKPTRRKMDFSTPKKAVEKAPAPKNETKTRKRSPPADISADEPKRITRRTRASLEKASAEPDDGDDAMELVGGTSEPIARTPRAAKAKAPRREPPAPIEAPAHEAETQEITRTPISDSSNAGTSKISLPFSDTPVIDRNKNMRKKDTKRRSSLGLRGRRASSLIDGGHTATPHSAVPTTEFYKHIEAENLTEPRRMKQLLTWCGERALGEKPAHGEVSAAVLARLQAARHIQEQLLKDFGTKSEMSDWFSREPTKRRVVLVKNPLNESNATRIVELEERIKRYVQKAHSNLEFRH